MVLSPGAPLTCKVPAGLLPASSCSPAPIPAFSHHQASGSCRTGLAWLLPRRNLSTRLSIEHPTSGPLQEAWARRQGDLEGHFHTSMRQRPIGAGVVQKSLKHSRLIGAADPWSACAVRRFGMPRSGSPQSVARVRRSAPPESGAQHRTPERFRACRTLALSVLRAESSPMQRRPKLGAWNARTVQSMCPLHRPVRTLSKAALVPVQDPLEASCGPSENEYACEHDCARTLVLGLDVRARVPEGKPSGIVDFGGPGCTL